MIKKISLLLVASTFGFTAMAQMTPPKKERNKASGLMANNVSIAKQAQKLDSAIAKLIEEDLLREEETVELEFDIPASDLYEGAWGTRGVNDNRIHLKDMPDSVEFDLSNFIMPIEGEITSEFGPRHRRYHYGIDLKVNVGDPIGSAFDGKVRITSFDRRGYGHYVVVRHENGLETVYGHLSKIKVFEGQVVRAGQTIGLGGNTGRSTGPHLHFETRFLGNPINPTEFIDFEDGTIVAAKYLMVKSQAYDYVKIASRTSKFYTYPGNGKTHRVRKGDTLSRIASRNGTTVSRICKLNGFSRRKTLRPGQRIRL